MGTTATATLAAPPQAPLLYAEPDATAYAVVHVVLHDEEEQRRGVERVRTMLVASTGGYVDCVAAFFCPCVSAAQIASSVGGSYLRNLVAFSALYLGGMQLLVLAMKDFVGGVFAIQHVAYAIVLEVLFFLVGPVIAAPAVTFVLFCVDFMTSLDEDPASTPMPAQVYFFVWGDMLLDSIFACAALVKISRLRERVHAPPKSCCRHCAGVCCVWAVIGNASASAKQYAHHADTFYLGPLDTIPAYAS